ncbi:MAG: CBS domain-containing protein [Verrucomicrobia bacterium]|nr:CBS domain-containing protein [Verrucomicrobiota bacterium]
MHSTGTIGALLQQKGSTVWSTQPDATVYQAIELMAEKGVGALAVLEGGRLVGMFSERDYTRKVILKGKSSRTTPVREIMSDHDLVVAAPGDGIVASMDIMTERRVRHLPVVENGALLGLVSMGDLVKWVMSEQTAAIEQLTRYVMGEA